VRAGSPRCAGALSGAMRLAYDPRVLRDSRRAVGSTLLLTLLVGIVGSWPAVVVGSGCCCHGGDCHSAETQRCETSLVAAACCDEPLSVSRSAPVSTHAVSVALPRPLRSLGLAPWMRGHAPATTRSAYVPTVVLRL
jgi:hypothetical protein